MISLFIMAFWRAGLLVQSIAGLLQRHSFAVVVTTPNRRVIPANTLAYQRHASFTSFCENFVLLRAVSHANASARQQHTEHSTVLDEVGT